MNADKPSKEPDLKVLVDKLKAEVANLHQLSSSINNKLGFIDKSNRPQDKVNENNLTSCFIDEVNLIIATLRDLRVEMEDTESRMRNLVG